MAARILSDACRKTCKLYFSTSYGWIYYRNLFDDHFDASAEINGRNSRNWRIIRTVRAYRKTAEQINLPSLILGILSLVILLVAKKIMPKFPMAVVMMAAGAVLTQVLPMKEWGIKTLDAVAP